MSDSAAVSLATLLRHKSFANFWSARVATTTAYQMQAVAIGWQIYDMTGSALDLGLVGLVQFFPVVVMSIAVGQVADRYDRRTVVRICQCALAVAAAALAIGTAAGWLSREAIFALLFLTGTARAFELPTLQAMLPGIVPAKLLSRAIAASASATQTAIICGPALGGLIYGLGPAIVYALCATIFAVANILVTLIAAAPPATHRPPVTLTTMLAGFSYISVRPVLLGVISLDLFAMLLGGVPALLPIFARDILATGPWGLGLLRSAPALGALGMSALLAHFSLDRRVGVKLFASVAVFGASIIVFALSTSLAVSMAALFVYGAADAVSVVIRHSLVQTRTPSDMLGRVIAVNSMFTGTTGTLGDFRAGAIAQALGAVPSALAGGIGALLVTALWMWWFPDLKRIESLAHETVVPSRPDDAAEPRQLAGEVE